MAGFEPKKLALIRILQLLEEYTDCDHPLTQEQIAALLDREYGIDVERKAVGRNLSLLKEAGYPVASAGNGSYLEQRVFDDTELRLLIDSVLSGRYISAAQSKSMIERLCKLSNRYFQSHVKHVHSIAAWDKTENKAVFLNMELIDTAITDGRQIRYEYHHYGADKKLHLSSAQTVTPFLMLLHNQQYYLMGYSERWNNIAYHRLDRMVNMELTDRPAFPLKQVPGLENGIDYGKLTSERPYLFNDAPERVELIIARGIIDQMIDWFGKKMDITEIPGETDRVRVSLTVSPTAMLFWALQYINYAEVVSPADLRQRVADSIRRGMKMYGVTPAEV